MSESESETNISMRVVCIGGTGHSGSTLLTRMLGQLPGFVAIGEIGYLWDKGLIEDRICGCGQPFSECPFWTEVGRIGFGGWKNVDAAQAVALRATVERQRRRLSVPRALPYLLTKRFSRAYEAAMDAYGDLTRRVYESVQHVSGAEVIVDSTKLPTHVNAVRRIESVELRVVHLVRDSRGVAYSSLKRVPRQGGPPGALRERSAPVNTAARWMWINLSFHLLARLGTPTTLLRYEDLIASPRASLLEIARLAERPATARDLGFLADGTVELPLDHLVAGNRVRLATDRLALRVDDEWQRQLSPRDRRLVSVITWPLRRRYASENLRIGSS
jgi:Sulfotransferase family